MRKIKLIFGISLLIISLNIWAQEVDTTLNISGVEVFGNHTENFQKIKITDNNRSKEDVGKILKQSPNINLIKRGNFATDPVIRGFKSDQLQLLSNGFMQTNPACPNRMDAPSSHIQMEDLESIEIIKGPYSVRYGMNTGGIVNFKSKDPQASEQYNYKLYAGYFYQSNGGSTDAQARVQISDRKYFFKLYGSLKDFGNYKSGNGTEILSSFKHKDYGAQAAWFLHPKHSLIFDWKQSFAEDVLFAALPMDGDFDDSSTGALRYLFKNPGQKLFKAELKAYGNWIDHQMSNHRRPNIKMVDAVAKLQSQTFGMRGDLSFKISKQHHLIFGVDYKMIAKQGDRERIIYFNPCSEMVMDPPKNMTDAIWQDSKQSDMGAFVESTWALSKEWTWNAGLRVDYVSSSIGEPAPDFQALYPDLEANNDMAVMVNSQLDYMMADGISLEWSIGLGQRAPELIERYINHLTVGLDTYEYVGNPNLKMEQNFQNDLQLNIKKEKVLLEVTVFYALIKNYIQANLDTTLSRKFMPCMEPKHAKRYENVEDARLYGFELASEYVFWKNISLYGSWAYTIGENKSMDEALAEIPPMEVNAGLKYQAKKWSARFNSRFVMAQDRISTSFNESASEAFQVFDFNANYRIWRGLNVSINIENIFDENYVEHLSRAYKNQIPGSNMVYWEPGRNFIMGLSFKF